jgi:hypothetical protein
MPGLIQGECIEQDGKGYLSITVAADPSDPRRDDAGNDFLPGWGLHGIDVSLAQGDLVRLAQKQADTGLKKLPPRHGNTATTNTASQFLACPILVPGCQCQAVIIARQCPFTT